MVTSGAASAGTVSESELSDSSHNDIDESIQHNTKGHDRVYLQHTSQRLQSVICQ